MSRAGSRERTEGRDNGATTFAGTGADTLPIQIGRMTFGAYRSRISTLRGLPGPVACPAHHESVANDERFVVAESTMNRLP